MIRLSDVSYTYAKGTPFEKTALFNVELEIGNGEFIAIVGSTGSGKSTLIQVMAGLLTVEGVTSDGRIGLVFQRPEDQLFEETVEAELAFAPKNFGCKPEEIARRVTDAMRQVGLPDQYRLVSPLKLSGGERRRVAIASILSMQPSTLILDEPTAGLDARSKAQQLDEIKRLNDGGTTILMVTHDMDAAARLAQRIIVMSDGRVIADGDPRGVFGRADVIERAGLSRPTSMAILDRLRAKGVEIESDAIDIDECEARIRKCFKM